MAICGNCKQPCSCLITEDGIWGGHEELGRNFTQVEGTGTTEDPYVIHFMDQMEFRPQTAEIMFNNVSVPNAAVHTLIVTGISSHVVYQSPRDFLIREPALTTPVYRYASGSFYIMGASATFAQATDTTANIRAIALSAILESPAGNPVEVFIGGQTSPGGNTDPLTLSCEGMSPGLFTQAPGLGSITQQFSLSLLQDSGAPLIASDIRIWMTQI